MNPRVIAAALIVIVAAIGLILFASQRDEDEVVPVPSPTAVSDEMADPDQTRTTVTLTDSGFSPDSVTIDVGESVVFRNESGSPAIIASDPHPQHTDLSELESDTVAAGGTYTFTFGAAGTFGIHNHLNPSQTGEVIVR